MVRGLSCSVAHEIFPDPGIKPVSPPVLAGTLFTTEPPGKPHVSFYMPLDLTFVMNAKYSTILIYHKFFSCFSNVERFSYFFFFFPIVTNTTNNVLHYLELLKSLLINIIGKNPEYDNLMAFRMYDHVMVVVVKLCLTLASPWTVACQAPLSIGFSRQEYWSGLLFPSPGDLFHPRIESRSSVLQAYAAILSYEGIP